MLRADSIELSFNGFKILQDIYLDCKPAEIVGLLGRNGCGKSSLLKVIFGTLNPSFKHISIDEKVTSKGYQNNLIAYMPQHNYLPDAVSLFKLAKMMVAPPAWNEFAEYPIFKKYSQSKASELSGGELRQIETLMLLHSRASYILLDEPFTQLSPIQVQEFKPIIQKCARKKGIIITDHLYSNILEISDRIIFLDQGCTKHIKSAEELITYGYINKIIT